MVIPQVGSKIRPSPSWCLQGPGGQGDSVKGHEGDDGGGTEYQVLAGATSHMSLVFTHLLSSHFTDVQAEIQVEWHLLRSRG